jgi:phage terminase small subunit
MAKRGTSKAAAAQRKRLFAEKFLALGENWTQAAIAIGHKPGSAAEKAGHRASKDVQVQALIAEGRVRAVAAAKATSDEVLISAARQMRFDARKLVDDKGKKKALHQIDDDTALAIDAVEIDGVKIRVNRAAAREQLMRHLGLFEADNRQQPAPVLKVGKLTARLSFDNVRSRAKAAAKRA